MNGPNRGSPYLDLPGLVSLHIKGILLTVVCACVCIEILFILEKERNPPIFGNVDEPGGHYSESEKQAGAWGEDTGRRG